MEKKILLLTAMLCTFALANGQGTATIDNAVVGTGLNKHRYIGSGWVHGSSSPTFYNSTLSYTNVPGSYVELTFEGNKIEWFTEKKNTHGIVAVSIDGGPESTVDLYSSAVMHGQTFTSQLSQGTHTIKIRATGTKNSASTGTYAIHDYFVISQGNTGPDSTNTFAGLGAMRNFGIPGLPESGGVRNSAFGFHAIGSTYSSNDNTAVGYDALPSTFEASGNTAIGANTMGTVTRAPHNTAVGFMALNGTIGMGEGGNTAIGAFALDIETKGNFNTAIGTSAGPSVGGLTNSTAIGAYAKTTASNQVRIGNSGVTSIGGEVSWSTLSDGRFKKDIKEDVSGLAFINNLRPVSYMVDKKALRDFLKEPDSLSKFEAKSKQVSIRQTGFVAQEVDELVKKSKYVFHGVDAPKNNNDPYTIRYSEFVVPLVKAVQELTAMNEDRQRRIEQQQEQIEQLLKQLGKGEGLLKDTEISLLQNGPTPASTNTDIKMILPESIVIANVIVYNLEGKQLKEMKVNQRGQATVTIPASELTAGMYIYALIADGKVIDTKRMILTK